MYSLLRNIRVVFYRPSPDTWATDATTEHNIRCLQNEILFASVMSTAILSFTNLFVIRLGASKELVALLSSLPALVAAIFSIPSARWAQKRRKRKPWLLGSLMMVRIGYCGMALIPIIFKVNPAAWLIGWFVILQLPSIFFTNLYQSTMAELIPEKRRATVFSRRIIYWSVGVVVTSTLGGRWLDSVEFPHNFQWMYIFGFIIAMGSTWFIYRLEIPDTKPAPANATAAEIKMATQVQLRGNLGKTLINLAVYLFGINFIASLGSIYYADTLKASNEWFGLLSASGSAGAILGNYLWSRLMRTHSFMWAIRRATLFTWLYPVGVALVPNLTFIIALNFFVNLIHPGYDLAALNLMMKQGGIRNRTMIMSWYNAVLNACIFVAPLAGTLVANMIGIVGALIVSGILRFLGGILWELNPVTEPQTIE